MRSSTAVRLGRLRAREAGQQRALARDRDLRVARAEGQRPLGKRECLVTATAASRRGRRHATPTWTPRKRAGAAPWDTCMTWPGSPLPQFISPQSAQAPEEQTASSEPQKRGVTPA